MDERELLQVLMAGEAAVGLRGLVELAGQRLRQRLVAGVGVAPLAPGVVGEAGWSADLVGDDAGRAEMVLVEIAGLAAAAAGDLLVLHGDHAAGRACRR